MKKFLHKIIVLNQQERQEAELRTRITQYLSGRVRPPDATTPDDSAREYPFGTT